MRRLLFVSLLAALLTACAGARVTRVLPGKDSEAHGFRYYQSSPYLIVHTDNKGGLTSRIEYLPDPNRLMSYEPYSKLSSNATTLEFKNGVLTGATSDIDETVVPIAALKGVEAVLSAALKASLLDKVGTTTVPLPALFKIVFDRDGGVRLVGGPPMGDDDKPLTIRVVEPAKE